MLSQYALFVFNGRSRGHMASPQSPESETESNAAESGRDPIAILILVAANGYARDIVAVGVLSRDPDL